MRNHTAAEKETFQCIKICLWYLMKFIYSYVPRYTEMVTTRRKLDWISIIYQLVWGQKPIVKSRLSLRKSNLNFQHRWCQNPPFDTIVSHFRSLHILTTHLAMMHPYSIRMSPRPSKRTCLKRLPKGTVVTEGLRKLHARSYTNYTLLCFLMKK
jgi:hypothetical protein